MKSLLRESPSQVNRSAVLDAPKPAVSRRVPHRSLEASRQSYRAIDDPGMLNRETPIEVANEPAG